MFELSKHANVAGVRAIRKYEEKGCVDNHLCGGVWFPVCGTGAWLARLLVAEQEKRGISPSMFHRAIRPSAEATIFVSVVLE
jgi:hypothetical protein